MTQDNAMLAVDIANPDLSAGGKLRLPGAMVHIELGIALGDGALFLTLDLRNYGGVPASFRLDFHLDADFADIFEVRGAVRPRRGVFLPVEWRPEGPRYAYRGLDGVIRRTSLAFDPPPDPASDNRSRRSICGGRSAAAAARCKCERQGGQRSGGQRRRSTLGRGPRHAPAASRRPSHIASAARAAGSASNESSTAGCSARGPISTC
jgi:hypothetical protein